MFYDLHKAAVSDLLLWSPQAILLIWLAGAFVGFLSGRLNACIACGLIQWVVPVVLFAAVLFSRAGWVDTAMALGFTSILGLGFYAAAALSGLNRCEQTPGSSVGKFSYTFWGIIGIVFLFVCPALFNFKHVTDFTADRFDPDVGIFPYGMFFTLVSAQILTCLVIGLHWLMELFPESDSLKQL